MMMVPINRFRMTLMPRHKLIAAYPSRSRCHKGRVPRDKNSGQTVSNSASVRGSIKDVSHKPQGDLEVISQVTEVTSRIKHEPQKTGADAVQARHGRGPPSSATSPM